MALAKWIRRIIMEATVQTVQSMLNALDAGDLRTAIRFI